MNTTHKNQRANGRERGRNNTHTIPSYITMKCIVSLRWNYPEKNREAEREREKSTKNHSYSPHNRQRQHIYNKFPFLSNWELLFRVFLFGAFFSLSFLCCFFASLVWWYVSVQISTVCLLNHFVRDQENAPLSSVWNKSDFSQPCRNQTEQKNKREKSVN